MFRAMKAVLRLLFVRHLLLSLAGVLLVTQVLSERVVDRGSFADSDMKKDVMDRWGAPIEQPSPSVRYVASGAVFGELRALPLAKQQVDVEASMNYRKRGLVYFSGFDFALHGAFEVKNPEATDIDLAFVFPLQMKRNAVLLSDLSFQVNGEAAQVELSEETDKLVWTGRAKPGETLSFAIAYRGRGLDSFVWRLDPATRVNDFRMTFRFKGGSNFDYPPDVLSAGKIEPGSDGAALTWSFPSLESGVPVGLILPSQQSFDGVIARCSSRAWAFFALLFAGTLLLFVAYGREVRLLEAGLVACSFAIVYPLLGYLAAVMPFWAALVLSLAIGSALLMLVAALFLSRGAVRAMAGLVALCLIVPTLAVVLDGYTGLIYTLEATAVLSAMVVLIARPGFRSLVERALLQGDASQAPPVTPKAAAPAVAATSVLAILVFALAASPAFAQTPATEGAGTANLPLSELLRLQHEADRVREDKPVKAPVAAVVERVEISGLLLDDAAELSAHVEAQVFADSWTVLPILQRDAQLHVLSFPKLESATLAVNGGALALVTQRPGAYAFDVGLRAQARVEGSKRRVRLALGASTAASLKLKYDSSLFKLEARNAVAQADGVLLFPEDGAFSFSWEPTAPAAARAQKEELVRHPTIEAVVERARASVVSTLAGRRLVRVLYELKLEGAHPIAVKIPEGYVLERVFVNGASRELLARDGVLALEVSPERAGDARGRLELLLSEEPGRFKLSGELRFVLPAASWRTDAYVVELHLPEVFNYRWRGGSLSPCAKDPEPAEFSSQLPTPGRALCLSQTLVFEPPTAEVAYHVDLAGKYWAGATGH